MHVQGESLLAEKEGFGLRWVEVGDLQNAGIDGGQRHPHIASRCVRQGQLHRLRPARAHRIGRGKGQVQGLRVAVAWHVDEPDGAARRTLTQRAVERGHDIEIANGLAACLQTKRLRALVYAQRHDPLHAAIRDDELRLACKRSVQRERECVAGRVARRVETQLETVRGVRPRARPAPAGAKLYAGHAVRLLDLEPVLAIVQRAREAERRVGGDGDALRGLQPVAPVTAITPATVLAEPLIVVVLDIKAQRRFACHALARARQRDYVDLRRRAASGIAIVEGRLEADVNVTRPHGQQQAVAYVATARLRDAAAHPRAQRQCRVKVVPPEFQHGRIATLLIRRSRRDGHERFAKRLHRIAELVSGEIGKRVRVGLYAGFDLGLKVAPGRTVEEVGRHGERARLSGDNGSVWRAQRHAQLLGHEVLHRPAQSPDDCVHAVQRQPRRVAAARRARRNGDIAVESAGHVGRRHADLQHFGAVGLGHDKRAVAVKRRPPGPVPDQRAEAHGLAWAVHAAIRVEIGLHRARRVAARHVEARQVKRAARQVQCREVRLAAIRQQEFRGQIARSAHGRARNDRPPVCIRDRLGQQVVVARDHRDTRFRQCLGGVDGPRSDVQGVRAAIGRQRDIGHVEPTPRLCRAAHTFIGDPRELDDIGPGSVIRDHVGQRIATLHERIGIARHVHRVGVDFHARSIGVVIVAPLALDGGLADIGFGLEQGAVVDPVHRQARVTGIHRLETQHGVVDARQDDAVADKAHHGGFGIEGDVQCRGVRHLASIDGCQARQHADLIGLIGVQTQDAELASAHVERERHVGHDADEGLVLDDARRVRCG